MNRSDRRRAAREERSHAAHRLDCGCTPRVLQPVETPVCPGCGVPSRWAGSVPIPTSAPVGTLKMLEVGCNCGTDYEAPFLVVA